MEPQNRSRSAKSAYTLGKHHTVQCTPVRKRRAKISLSPVKTPRIINTATRRASFDANSSTNQPCQTSSYLPTAALEFEEFSFIGPDGELTTKHLTRQQDQAVRDYLVEMYNASDIWYAFPFLIVECEDPPREEERPFTICGALALWITSDSKLFWPVFRDIADGEDDINIEPEI